MGSMAKQCFFFIRLWRGFVHRVRTLYYRMVLGGLGARSVVTSKVFIEHPYNVFIGEDVTVNEYAILQGGPSAQIKIGDRVHISYGVLILTASLALQNGFYRDEHEAKSVVVEDDVWIAAKAIVLPGIKIGARSVVAAGAVVTHDVEPDTVVAGVPAKPIRNLKSKNSL
jgi:maltose O-acetyltransferase